MTNDLLHQLEQKVAHAVELIELMQIHIEELENENIQLRTEHDRWKQDLSALLKRFDKIDAQSQRNKAPHHGHAPIHETAEDFA